MGVSVSSGIPQWLFMQSAAPTATYQGQLWVDTTSATGVLYQANSALSWVQVVENDIKLITTITQAADSGSFDLTSLDFTGYKSAIVVIDALGTNGAGFDSVNLKFNNDATAVYNGTQLYNGARSVLTAQNSLTIGVMGGGSANNPNNWFYEMRIFHPAGSGASIKFIGHGGVQQCQDYIYEIFGDYYKTSPVAALTRITFTCGTSQFLIGSKAYIYGVK